MISFRFLDLQADLERVHGWMQQPHVLPWWGLEGPVQRVVGPQRPVAAT